MKIALITTANHKIYNEYARQNLEKFLTFWPDTIEKHLYSEDNLNIEGYIPHDLFYEAPELKNFLERHQNTKYIAPAGKVKTYKNNLLKWPYKVFSQWLGATNLDSDIMIYIDCDIITLEPISLDTILEYYNPDKFVAYLNRDNNFRHKLHVSKWCYSETGLLIYNLKHKNSKEFFNRFVNFWITDEILKAPDCVDNTIFDILLKQMEKENKFENIIMGDTISDNPLETTTLGKFLKHTMGDNKIVRNEKLYLS